MEPVSVRVGDCTCPDSPHTEGDHVYLSPTLPIDGGITAEQDLFAVQSIEDEDARGSELTRRWLRTFVRYGVTGWDFLDAEGDPRPLDVEAILADWTIARTVANRASELYSDSVMAPFQQAPAKRSPTGRTPATTSRQRRPTPVPSA